MRKRTIVIASVLKPVDDTRALEKMGVSLSESGNYQVIIIGYPSTAKPVYPNITFLPHKSFRRLSFQRLLVPLRVFVKTFQVKHDILIVNTHELLIVALLNRILFGRIILYDIQENYYRNILYTNAFPKLFRSILGLFVRAKETITAPLFKRFLLAEKGYESELTFIKNKYTIIENKPRIPTHLTRVTKAKKTRLLFSGTLGESTGLFQAIDLAKKLHDLDPEITLHIIGYAAQPGTLLRIKNEIAENDFISVRGGDELVPHKYILEAIFNADFGIITYPTSPHTQNSMPTKLFEYVAAKLPILLREHPNWVEFCHPFNAAIILRENLTATKLLAQMQSQLFYTQPTDQVSWTTEETKLLQLLHSI